MLDRITKVDGKSLVVIAITLCLTAGVAPASEVAWSDLPDPSVQEYDDPYRDLTYDQIDSLRTIVQLRDRLNSSHIPEEKRGVLEVRLSGALKEWKTLSVDPDWLIAQRWAVAERRERAATAGNPAVNGQAVTLAGFAIAGPPDEDGTNVIYLVPERGMCSHMPPPPPNQMLRVRLTGDWRPSFVHEPVRITGRLSIDPSEQVFRVVDGPVAMNATFRMQATEVVAVGQMRVVNDPGAVNEWAARITAKLRAAGQPSAKQSTATE